MNPDAISGSGPFVWNNTGASTDPVPPTACGLPENDVWFTWTASQSGTATVTLCGQTTVDTILAIYDGAGCPVAPAIACNDDLCGTASQADFAAVAGNDYTIRIGGSGGERGDGVFTITTACGAPGTQGPQAKPEVFCNIVPARWQAPDVLWTGDVAPHNKIDDQLDASSGLEDIVVNFRRPVTAADVSFLENLGTTSSVQKVCRYITSVSMTSVSPSEIVQIAAHPGVAFIERQPVFHATTGVNVQNIRVQASTDYSTDTVEDKYPTLNGSGVNIAIIDSGVDNLVSGTPHPAFAATPFIGGYNAITNTYGDPDDDLFHGTHVASIALGQASGVIPRGVAPAAGLIDIKVLNSSGIGTWSDIIEGLQVLYDNRDTWNPKVVNMSFGGGPSSDGTDSMCQMVDLGESMGLVMVAAVGNNGPVNIGISAPAAATRAITVAGSDDVNTVDRSDDSIYCVTAGSSCSARGPRASDSDADDIDELKPEVTAPGTNILAAGFNTTNNLVGIVASGTSMAAPHVAGLAALILQQSCPGMNPASVKQRIISTTDPLPGFTTPYNSSIDATWNDRAGWGLINGFAAIDAGATPVTDLTFPNDPADPSWESIDITTSSLPPHVGVLTTVTAMIKNAGSVAAVGARIQFGVHVYSAAIPTYHDIGTKIVTLFPGNTAVSVDWIPEEAAHQCLQVEIGYGQDSVCSNNYARRNVSVANSPIHFEVQNTLTEAPATIDLSVACTGVDTTGWSVELTPSTLVLAGCDPPVDVTALAIPADTVPAGTTIKVQVAAKIGNDLLGGVSFFVSKKDCNGNTVDDYLDIQNGTSADANGNGVPDECDPGLIAFCFPGTGGIISCPCGNPPASVGRGCNNFAGGGTGGAILAGTGMASVSADTLGMNVSGGVGSNVLVLFQGTTNTVNTRSGAGVRCVGGTLKRLYKGNEVAGSIAFPNNGVPFHLQSAAKGYPITPPVTLYYYASYRNSAANGQPGCPGLNFGFNTTNAGAVHWKP